MPLINATLLLTAAIAAVGGPLLGFGPPTAAPSTRRADAEITIDDGVRHLEAGRAVSYRVRARAGDHEPAAIRLTVPAGLHDLTADGATRNGSHLSWPVTLAPGQTRDYTADATVDPGATAGDLAVTACLQAAGDRTLTCATDLDLVIERAHSRGVAWLGAAFFGLLAALGGIWLHRRIRPEPLTPANAHLIFTDPGKPGAAPTG